MRVGPPSRSVSAPTPTPRGRTLPVEGSLSGRVFTSAEPVRVAQLSHGSGLQTITSGEVELGPLLPLRRRPWVGTGRRLRRWARETFCDMSITVLPTGLILYANVIDESHLLGILTQCRMLNLVVVSAPGWYRRRRPGHADPADRRVVREQHERRC